jgi:Uma2 family endonuclease
MPIQMVLPTRDTFCMTSIQFPTPVSDEELMRISRENPGMVVERLGYSQINMSPSGTESGGQSARVFAQVARWAEDRNRGEYFGPDTGFLLNDGSVLSPDAAWVSDERIREVPGPDRDGFWPLCPELVIEVASRSDSRPQLMEKCHRWIKAGAQVAILIDPDRRTSHVLEQSGGVTESAALVLPVPQCDGLTLNLERVWLGISGRASS